MKTRKGIVVEADNNKAIIFMPSGEYKKVPTRGKYLEVGDLYEYKSTPATQYVIAAVLLLAFVMGVIDYNLVKAYASLGTDLDLGINRWGRVVSVQAKSMEGQQILESFQLKNVKLEFAVENITRQAMQERDKSPQEIRQILKTKIKDENNQKFEKNIRKDINNGLDRAISNEKIKIKNRKQNGNDQNKQQQKNIKDLPVNTQQLLNKENDASKQLEIILEENSNEQNIFVKESNDGQEFSKENNNKQDTEKE